VAQKVNLPELLNAEALSVTEPASMPSSNNQAPSSTMASLAIDEEGRDLIVLDLEGSRDQVSAKQLITRLSEEFGLTLDVPWNFIPERLVLYAKKR
jgi:hypothetical protein